MKILAVDVGGTHVKILATGEKQKREIVSGPRMTARQMVSRVKKIAQGWAYDAVSVGFPGPVLHDRPIAEPHNLGPGWMGFDFASAFGLPVRVINDAAMQALGSYEGGKMLFRGLGTGLGSAMKRDCRHDEHIHRSDPISVVAEECPPALGWRVSSPDHVLSHARLSDIDAELEEFSMDPRRSPQRIGNAHLADKLAYLQRNCWPATPLFRFPSPI